MSSLSISSATNHASPRADMNQRLASALSSGSISEEDATAISSALDAIDSTLESTASSSGSSRLSPSDMKSRVDSLIEEQVSNGTLTEEQAAELQALFAQGPGSASGGAQSGGAQSGAGASAGTEDSSSDAVSDVASASAQAAGMQGPMGPPPPPQSSAEDEEESLSAASAEEAQMSALLEALKKLREGMANSQGTYSVGESSQSAGISGRIIDQMA